MKFMVGETAGGTAVYAVNGENAVDLTALDPSVGGDLIALGTPPGVGHAKKPHPRWLKPGEMVEIEIEGIGICASPVIDEARGAAQ